MMLQSIDAAVVHEIGTGDIREGVRARCQSVDSSEILLERLVRPPLERAEEGNCGTLYCNSVPLSNSAGPPRLHKLCLKMKAWPLSSHCPYHFS